jgi:hypothetical protein
MEHQAMMANWGVEVELLAFLDLSTRCSMCSAALFLVKDPLVPNEQEEGWTHTGGLDC